MDCSPPGSSVCRTFQARILEWVTISFSKGSSWPRDWTRISCLLHWQVDSLPMSHQRSPWKDILKQEREHAIPLSSSLIFFKGLSEALPFSFFVLAPNFISPFLSLFDLLFVPSLSSLDSNSLLLFCTDAGFQGYTFSKYCLGNLS